MSDYVLKIGDREYRAQVREITSDRAIIVVDDTTYDVDLVEIGRRSAPSSVQRKTTRSAPSAPPKAVIRPTDEAPGAVAAPLPGLILRLSTKEGDIVEPGQPLLVMEAMKMENVVTAPHHGKVKKVFVAEGASVSEGDPLVEIARPKMTTL
jgi:glutaconyl-CoA/methylmalonyl-CoA decarboxylase subunit gamma